ncbi:MAG: M48 family metallopeptidase [Patescibacteria group bacterium]
MRTLPTAETMPFEAELRVHPRARRLSIRVHPGGRTLVTVPHGVPYGMILRFMRGQAAWVARTSEIMRRFKPRPTKAEARRDYLRHKEAARRLAYAAIARFAPTYGVAVKAVSIRDQKTRWGSCSRDGRVSFNYRIALLPERMAEYIVVHELCHILAFDHSPRFWALVARTVPEHRMLRKTLHQEHPLQA